MTSHPVTSYQAATLLVYSDSEAARRLSQPEFLAAWRTLLQKCPWSTALQTPEFVRTWYEHYRDTYRPLVLTRYAPGGEMDGLMALAVEHTSGKLTFAGANQAEYQVWLALPGEQTFITACLDRLRQLGFASLSFTYLPPATPLDWLKGDWQRRSTLRTVQRPLLAVDDIDAVKDSLSKKKNRRRLEKLQADGPMTFLKLRTGAELDPYYDEIIAFYDFRMGAVHGNCPFRDDSVKRDFYRALMSQDGLLHVTITKIGEKLIASHMGVRSGNELILGIVGHSPFMAIHSPGKLHILQLGLLLHEEGFSTLDLTPGGDAYKEDRATRYQDAHVLTIFLDDKALLRHRTATKLRSLARSAAAILRVDRKSISRWQSATRRPGRSLRSLLQVRVWGSTELRLYRAKANPPQDLNDSGVRRDYIADLLSYAPTGAHDASRQEFLSAALARIEAGGHTYSMAENGTLVSYAMLARADKTSIPELHQAQIFPPTALLIEELYARSSSQQQEFAQGLLVRISGDASASGAEFVYVAAPAKDVALLRTIENAGFEYEASVFRSARFGSVRVRLSQQKM